MRGRVTQADLARWRRGAVARRRPAVPRRRARAARGRNHHAGCACTFAGGAQARGPALRQALGASACARLIRVQFGPLRLGDLRRRGPAVPLTDDELAALNRLRGRTLRLYCEGSIDRSASGASMNLDDWRSRINNLDARDPRPPQPARRRRPPHRRAQEAAGSSLLRPGARGPGPRSPRHAESRSARPPTRPRDLAGDPLGLARAREPPAGGLSCGPPATYTHQAARAALRLLGGLPAACAPSRKSSTRSSASRARIRRGAGGELHRGRGQRHPGPPRRLRRRSSPAR